jgi:hypothetical protein
MKRIGIAASKIAKGSIVLYNSYVVLISIFFSVFIFVIAGATVVFSIGIISYVAKEILPFERNWESILRICMISLTVIIVLFNIMAISMNLKFLKRRNKLTIK